MRKEVLLLRQWLHDARKAGGFSQQQMADNLGVSIAYYNMIESGKRRAKLDIPMACSLSKLLNVPIAEIIRQEADA